MSCSAQLSESIFISLILGVHVEDEKGRMILPSSKELPRMTQLPDRIVNLGNESAKFSRSVAFPSQHELYMTNVPSVCFFSCLERHRSVLCKSPFGRGRITTPRSADKADHPPPLPPPSLYQFLGRTEPARRISPAQLVVECRVAALLCPSALEEVRCFELSWLRLRGKII